MDLLLVAAKRDQINDYAQLARNAKMKPVGRLSIDRTYDSC